MIVLNPCPVCGDIPELCYCFGEYFVYSSNDNCPCCGLDFTEMHSSELQQIETWNKRNLFFKGVNNND